MSEKEGSLMWNGPAFTGSKIALIVGGGLITYKRDQKPDIPFPGMWDLPGGGREVMKALLSAPSGGPRGIRNRRCSLLDTLGKKISRTYRERLGELFPCSSHQHGL
ncbi:hypothetical protein GOB91_08335 [Sinorhizobium meliloti]|jgi:hypothetical protein|uniref:hypothetical protein n=1 Tax=Rhizobium meliloti TaxID=382 RepID=UPI000FD946E8|nr:hypothetical protein [Sinorhizobium meliloti]MCO6425117.1 hypothetical protein [Sinorhizobium meliloti]MDW9358541.1 hypothetical protein [Sinorhizobium meliloti]MDW9450066.1 hypothetical protein [Sinorhizobium meliloti]MDW9527166.1 hypothetical protein [Sinorhizobium meliloti]MDW9589470.1 hypothetical protein [Sinorhizobium meliloti]